MKRAAIATLAAVFSIALLAGVAGLFGHPPADVLQLLIDGSIGSGFAIRGTLLKSVPLLLTGLSVVIAFRAGVWNIGGEGQFIVGGLAALVAAPWGSLAALIAAAAAGALWSSIASLMRLWRNAPEVLTTILLNFIAIHLLGWSVNGPLREASGQYPQSDAAKASLPLLEGVHAGVLIAVAAAAALWWLLFHTTEGLRLRATGFNASASQFAGINVKAQIARAMAISGALAGLAGGIELLGVTHRLFERFAAGYGYSGIAVALLAQLHPLASIAAAFFFGALVSGAGELQRSANISATIATFAQAVVLLVIVASAAIRWRERDA